MTTLLKERSSAKQLADLKNKEYGLLAFARLTDLVDIVEKVNEIVGGVDETLTDSISETTTDAGVTINNVLHANAGITKGTNNVEEFTVLTTLTATEIVGTAAGDLGHADGAILVAAPTSAYALEFVSCVLIYDYATAAYTGGADDMVVRVGSTAVSTALTDTNCIKGTGDKVFRLGAIATEVSLGVGSTINLKSTAFTQPGTAAGVLRVYTTYRKIATGL